MAMRIVCAKCGCINGLDAYDCDHCGRDVSEDRKTEIPRKFLSFRFFNKLDGAEGSYSNTPPFESVQVKTVEPEPVKRSEPIKRTETPVATRVTDMVKICPSCATACDENALECECGCYLKRVNAVERNKNGRTIEKAEEPKLETVDFDCDFDDAPSEERLYLLIGRNGENEIPVFFNNNMFVLGRAHQVCLENCNYVSRTHCFLKLTENGDIYLGENRSHPSTNGTFIRTVGERRERLIPGKGYLVKSGSVFYLDAIPVILHKKLC